MDMVQDIVRIHCTCFVDSLKPIKVCSGWADQLSCVQIMCSCILFNNIKLWVYCISCRIKRGTLKKELDKCQGICRRLSMRALQEVCMKAAMEEWGSGTCMQVVYMQLQCRMSKANTPFCTHGSGYIHSCWYIGVTNSQDLVYTLHRLLPPFHSH